METGPYAKEFIVARKNENETESANTKLHRFLKGLKVGGVVMKPYLAYPNVRKVIDENLRHYTRIGIPGRYLFNFLGLGPGTHSYMIQVALSKTEPYNIDIQTDSDQNLLLVLDLDNSPRDHYKSFKLNYLPGSGIVDTWPKLEKQKELASPHIVLPESDPKFIYSGICRVYPVLTSPDQPSRGPIYHLCNQYFKRGTEYPDLNRYYEPFNPASATLEGTIPILRQPSKIRKPNEDEAFWDVLMAEEIEEPEGAPIQPESTLEKNDASYAAPEKIKEPEGATIQPESPLAQIDVSYAAPSDILPGEFFEGIFPETSLTGVTETTTPVTGEQYVEGFGLTQLCLRCGKLKI